MSDPAVHSEVIESIVVPRVRDLGGFQVRRVLPSAEQKSVGPFVFFDQMGPTEFPPGQGMDVRPHPHIGLATVTYLFDGEFRHQDSLGNDQMIYPGAVNWMVAGRGITHSERTSTQTREKGHKAFGIQVWVALPMSQETMAPRFEHHAKSTLPLLKEPGRKLRIILGTAFDQTSPVQIYSDMFYVDARLDRGCSVEVPIEYEERCIYIATGSVFVDGKRYESGRMLVLKPGARATAVANDHEARLILAGGAPLDSPRTLSWNFVASNPGLIDNAQQAWRDADWQAGQFKLPPGDNQEYTRLPD